MPRGTVPRSQCYLSSPPTCSNPRHPVSTLVAEPVLGVSLRGCLAENARAARLIHPRLLPGAPAPHMTGDTPR